MSKYQEFRDFMDNLANNKKDLTDKLADAQDKVTLFSTEYDSAKAMCAAVDNKLEELTTKLKASPTDIGLSAEFGIWTVRKSDYAGRVDTLKAALANGKKVYDELLKLHKDLDYGPLAEAATIEMNLHVKNLYSQLCEEINLATEARKTYLSVISKINKLKADGKNSVMGGQICQTYAKNARIENVVTHFDYNPKQFLVTESDVIKS